MVKRDIQSKSLNTFLQDDGDAGGKKNTKGKELQKGSKKANFGKQEGMKPLESIH